MSILVLNRFNPQYNPIKKWFRECPEDVILFVPMAYIDFYPKDCFTVVKGFDNYDITAVIFHIEYKLRQPRTLITP